MKQRDCENCGETFTLKRTGRPARYCTPCAVELDINWRRAYDAARIRDIRKRGPKPVGRPTRKPSCCEGQPWRVKGAVCAKCGTKAGPEPPILLSTGAGQWGWL